MHRRDLFRLFGAVCVGGNVKPPVPVLDFGPLLKEIRALSAEMRRTLPYALSQLMRGVKKVTD